MIRRPLALAAAIVLAILGVINPSNPTNPSAQTPEPIALETLMLRAGWYVDDFEEQFANVVAEENYVQDASSPLPAVMPTPGRGGTQIANLLFGQIRHRTLKSDFLLLHVQGLTDWVPFRDVLDVDGIPVRDRDERLTKLFITKSADGLEQAERISTEGARFNLGSMKRTINNPVLPLAVLQANAQERFRFTLSRPDPALGNGVWIVEFEEIGKPTLIRGRAGFDLFAKGRLWIDADSGRLLKSEMALNQPSLRAQVTTTYRIDEKFAVAVPALMEEQYVGEGGAQLSATATYGKFRRFDVSVEESLNK